VADTPADRIVQIPPEGEVGRDRGGEDAPRPVGRRRGDPAMLEIAEPPTIPEEVPDSVALPVTARDQDRARPELHDASRGLPPVGLGHDFHARKPGGLIEVRRDEVGERKETPKELPEPGGRQESGPAARAQHRVDDDVLDPVALQPRRHHPGVRRVVEHADLGRARPEIRENRLELLGHEPRRERSDRDDAARVLSGAGDDDRCAVNAVHGERQQVRLDTGPAPRIGARDRDGCHRPPSRRTSHSATLAEPGMDPRC